MKVKHLLTAWLLCLLIAGGCRKSEPPIPTPGPPRQPVSVRMRVNTSSEGAHEIVYSYNPDGELLAVIARPQSLPRTVSFSLVENSGPDPSMHGSYLIMVSPKWSNDITFIRKWYDFSSNQTATAKTDGLRVKDLETFLSSASPTKISYQHFTNYVATRPQDGASNK